MRRFALGLATGLLTALVLGCAGAPGTASADGPHGSWKLNYINYKNTIQLGEFGDATVHVYDTFVVIDRAGADEADTILPMDMINVLDIEYR